MDSKNQQFKHRQFKKKRPAEEWSQQTPFDDGSSRYMHTLEFQYQQQSQPFHAQDLLQERLHQPQEQAKPVQQAAKGTSVSRAALILTVTSFVSRFLGLLRGSMFSHIGTNQFTDAYNLAFTLPNLVFNIIAGGALLSAFIETGQENREVFQLRG